MPGLSNSISKFFRNIIDAGTHVVSWLWGDAGGSEKWGDAGGSEKWGDNL